MKCTNVEMEQMIAVLGKHLDRTDKIGYGAARNVRILRTEAAEYLGRRDMLIDKYARPVLGEDGKPTGRVELKSGTPEFEEFAKELEEWALIEHEPELYTIPASEAIGAITGADMLEIDWMFDWEESE